MKKPSNTKRIVFFADNVNHVRDVPSNMSYDEVLQSYYLERRERQEKGKEEELPAVTAETPDSIGPGTCPDCAVEFDRLDMHVRGGPACLKAQQDDLFSGLDDDEAEAPTA